MVRYALLWFLVALASGSAAADETSLAGLVAKPVALEIMREAGLHYLADLGADYLVDGDGLFLTTIAKHEADHSMGR